jgi:mRNA interferase HigB
MTAMRIIKEKTLRDFYAKHPQAKPGLCHWYNVASQAKLRKPTDVVASFRHADRVQVRSGNTVTVFNIGGGHYRLIAAIHYDKQRVFTLLILKHAEYGTGNWRDLL